MSKIHVLPDENLGGVLREYVEVERAANVGDKIVIVNPYNSQFGDSYTQGTIMTVTKRDEAGDVYCGKFDLIDKDEYRTLEPTDIVRIKETYEHGKWDYIRYRLVDRKAKVGEKVLIVNARPLLPYSHIGEVVEIIGTDGDTYGGMLKPYDIGEKGAVYRFQYRVLEPVEPAENELVTAEEGDDKSVIDLLANLARRVTELERQQKENRELIIKAFEGISGKDDEFTVEERVAMLEREVSGMYKRLRKSEEKIEMVLDDIVTLDERTQPLVALVKAVKGDE